MPEVAISDSRRTFDGPAPAQNHMAEENGEPEDPRDPASKPITFTQQEACELLRRTFEIYDDFLIVVEQEAPKQVGRIIIPDRHQTPPTCGVIALCGPEVKHYAVGDKIVYARFSGQFMDFSAFPRIRRLAESEVLMKVKDTAADLKGVDVG